jgi:hypothetical protein
MEQLWKVSDNCSNDCRSPLPGVNNDEVCEGTGVVSDPVREHSRGRPRVEGKKKVR